MGPFNSHCSSEGNMKWGRGLGDGGRVCVYLQPMIDPLTFIWVYTIPEHNMNSSLGK